MSAKARPGRGRGPGLQVGSFLLERELASGGMGTVWLARHRSGASAAVKIIAADRAAPHAIQAMQAEIRSIAALDHPNIVRVYDAGTLEQEHEEASQGALAAGSPWLAMELATGPISDLADRLDWELFSSLLLQVLDGLAHAHARGIIHRDLKPANLLYIRSPEPRVVLADFGLSWQLRGAEVVHGGSLPYAAPEQILGLQAQQGPGTDLYSLGCAAYRLACGLRPFRQRKPEALGRAHLYSPIPKVSPRFPVSAAFDDWLAGLMAKDPRDRFQCAADAAWALLQLPPPVAFEDQETVIDEVNRAVFRSADLEHSRTLPVKHWVARPVSPPASLGMRPREVRPPVPEDWVRPRDARPVPLGGRGLGLFGLREPAMVGRTAERDRLWEMLKTLSSPQLVVLRGGAGLGKSRLVSWLAERADEVGAATVLRASFRREAEAPRALLGLAGMVEDQLRTQGLALEPLLEHLRKRLPEGMDALAVARLLRPEADLSPWLAGPGDAMPAWLPQLSLSERVALARQLIEDCARSRRALVWLDEVQHGGEEPLALVEALASAGVPVLFVVTTRDAPPALDGRWHALVDRLEGLDTTLEPLTIMDVTTLISRMLPVEPELASQIARLTNGSPAVAVELVAHLVERGAIRGDAGGVWLEAEGGLALEVLATSLSERWSDALDRLVDRELVGARPALHVAAALGQAFAPNEWREVAGRLGIETSQALLAALANRGFIVAERNGRWAFAHPSLRALLLAEARASGPKIDLACAAVLSDKGDPFAMRAAAHQEAAGAHAEATGSWWKAIRWLSGWDADRALELAGRWCASLGRIEDPVLQRLHWQLGLAQLEALQAARRKLPRGEARRKLLEALLAQGQEEGEPGVEIRALIELSRLDLEALALERAEARAELAVHRARGTRLWPSALVHRAETRRIRGDLRGAERMLRELLDAPSERHPGCPALREGEQQPALLALARVLADAHRADEALELLSEARRLQRQAHAQALAALAGDQRPESLLDGSAPELERAEALLVAELACVYAAGGEGDHRARPSGEDPLALAVGRCLSRGGDPPSSIPLDGDREAE